MVADGAIRPAELQFLNQVCKRVGLGEEVIDEISHSPTQGYRRKIKLILPKSKKERACQLFDMVFMMMVDGETDKRQMSMCETMAKKLGYGPSIIQSIIKIVTEGIKDECSYEEISRDWQIAEVRYAEAQEKKELLESSKESNWVDEWNVGTITGIVISSILVFIVVIYLISLVYKVKQGYRPIPSEKFTAIVNTITLTGTALCLFLRSLRRGFDLWRGLLTVVGGSIMFNYACYTFVFIFFGRVTLTSSQGFRGLITMVIVTLFGAVLLIYGFKSKKA
jgi:hypothetical protein